MVNKSFTMLVKFINFLNGRPKLNIELTHLYKFRKRYNCYNNSRISPIYLHVFFFKSRFNFSVK